MTSTNTPSEGDVEKLREALRMLIRKYVLLMEAGRDRKSAKHGRSGLSRLHVFGETQSDHPKNAGSGHLRANELLQRR